MSGAFTRIYSEAQKRAVASAQLDAGHTALESIRLLMAGELRDPDSAQPVPPPPQQMPQATAYKCRRDEAARREGIEGPRVKNPLGDLDDFAARMVRLIRREQVKLERKKDPNLKRAKELAGLARETQALLKGVVPSQGPAGRRAAGGKGPSGQESDDEKGEAARLLAQHRATHAGRAAPETQRQNNGQGNRSEAKRSSQPASSQAETESAGAAGSLDAGQRHEQGKQATSIGKGA